MGKYLSKRQKLAKRNEDARKNKDHHFVFLRNSNSGVCVCGRTVRWSGEPGSKDRKMALHIELSEKEDNDAEH